MPSASDPLALGQIGQIALTISDLPRATAFYRDALGLRALPIPAPRLSFFDCAGIRLMLSPPEGESTGAGGSVLYFSVPDIRRAHAALVERGVAFAGDPHIVARLGARALWMAFFRDPDGNLLALMSEEAEEHAS